MKRKPNPNPEKTKLLARLAVEMGAAADAAEARNESKWLRHMKRSRRVAIELNLAMGKPAESGPAIQWLDSYLGPGERDEEEHEKN